MTLVTWSLPKKIDAASTASMCSVHQHTSMGYFWLPYSMWLSTYVSLYVYIVFIIVIVVFLVALG